jgi:type II restriction/modification system DNA methylase subunit YeeA
MRERFDSDGRDNNTNLKQILITNNIDVFIFDALVIENLFAKNKNFKKSFIEFEAGQKSGGDTGFFYNSICKPFIDTIKDKIEYTYVKLTDYRELLKPNDDSSKIINLYKLFSPTHLLKLNFANDSNTLDNNFYNELLHIIGLEEVITGGKKVIQQCKKPNYGSILENTIDQVKTGVRLSAVANIKSFGETQDQQIYNIALELVITWINRILFLKLLESQLITYNNSNEYKFVDVKSISDYDSLYLLFFKVLAVKTKDRRSDIAEKYKHVPYLNSSLFEITKLEHQAIGINTLSNSLKLPLASSTVLKDNNGKRLSGEKETLSYLLEFLDAYNFSSEGTAQVQEDNKTLINASVLGLIYEKLNGYKDGSFFTPGYITMYMCHETIRRAVVQKFNDSIDGVTFDSFDDLTAYTRRYFKTDDIAKFNKIVNSIRICDPAVGSGHFLVSALNELIAIKHELGILADKDFKPLPIDLEIENDELMITDRFDELFSYNPKSKDSQNIQKTLFHEKQTLIENCLFGVDINPNSVKICRLRLWIELLKNTYYKESGELEVLPNIDINIKCGNSLISRFDIDTPISKALKKSKLKVQDYKDAVYEYKNAKSKEQKENLENLIAEIKSNFQSEVASNDRRLIKLIKLRGELEKLETQDTMFEQTKAEEKGYKKQRKTYLNEIAKLEAELEEIKSNRIYDNAFEWRFEFPEVLADNGDFAGFDVVIGNPPYFSISSIKEQYPIFERMDYYTFDKGTDIYCLFYELSLNVLKHSGLITFITSNKWMRAGYGKKLRYIFSKNNPILLIDLGPNVFANATVDTNLITIRKEEVSEYNMRAYTIEDIKEAQDMYNLEFGTMTELNLDSWVIMSKEERSIVNKIEVNGKPLKDWDLKINSGIKTGYNEAFIIDGATKDRLIAEEPKCAKIIKPLLRGRDIKRYSVMFADLWLITAHNGYSTEKGRVERIKVEDYPAIKNHLDKYWEAIEKRYDKGDTPYNLRNCAYMEDFEKEKVVYNDITQRLTFFKDLNSYYINNTSYYIAGNEKLSYIATILNSKLIDYYYRKISTQLGKKAIRMFTQFVERIPIIAPNAVQETEITDLVNKILAAKKENPEADTTELEQEIDLLVYKLYDLTYDEVLIVDPETSITREAYGG